MASSSNKLGPGDFDESKYTWKNYKKEVEVWSKFTALAEDKKGPAFIIIIFTLLRLQPLKVLLLEYIHRIYTYLDIILYNRFCGLTFTPLK